MDFITNIETEVNNFIDQINSMIYIAEAYVVFTSVLLVILFIMVAAGLSRIGRLEQKIEAILAYEKNAKDKEAGYDMTDNRIKELLVLAESNSKYQSEKAKEELEKLTNEKGEVLNE